MIPFVIVAVIAGIIIFIVSKETFKYGDHQFINYNEYFYDEPSQHQKIRQHKAILFFTYNLYFTFLVTFLDAYVPSFIYQVLLVTVSLSVFSQTAIYYLFRKKIMAFLNHDYCTWNIRLIPMDRIYPKKANNYPECLF